MEIRRSCALARMYLDKGHPIDESYQELKLLRAAITGDEDAALALFCEKKLFGGAPCAIDTPWKRYEGLDGVRAFVREFLETFQAQSGELIPVIQTRANGRSVTEMQFNFVVDGMINQVPMFVVADLRNARQLDEVRMYTHATYVPGLQAYRKPMFPSRHMEAGEFGLMTGAVREYYEGLHALPCVDVDRIMNCMADDCLFGGYDIDDENHTPAFDKTEMRIKYQNMATYIPRCVGMRYETLIDDGRNCVIEWVHVVSRAGREERGRIAMSGIAAYERNDEGLLCAVRISDYAYMEPTIDWSKVPYDRAEAENYNLVETFPNGAPIKLS